MDIINYTIREITPQSITVDFEDGTWAIVPVKSNMDRSAIETLIADFNHTGSTFNSVEEIPFTVGEVVSAKNTAGVQEAAAEKAKQKPLTYKEIRQRNYPAVGDQLDALYWARTGDTTQLDEINAKIEEVKVTYPKDMEPTTVGEYEAMLEELANNVLG